MIPARWLDAIPDDGVLAAFAFAFDPSPAAWDATFDLLDAVEKADPARANVAPLRLRLDLLTRAAGIRPDVDLWPLLAGVSAVFGADASGTVDGAIVRLHAKDEAAADRLASFTLRRIARAISGPARAGADEPAPLKVAGRAVAIERQGTDVAITWGRASLAPIAPGNQPRFGLRRDARDGKPSASPHSGPADSPRSPHRTPGRSSGAAISAIPALATPSTGRASRRWSAAPSNASPSTPRPTPRRPLLREVDPMRLVDLHVDWLLQYAGESTVFDPADFPDIALCIGQADGYLGATSAAIVACYRPEADWSRQADPWSALETLLTRIEAEFSGRVLRDPADLARWRDDPEGLAWAVIGVEGFDHLIRTEADLARLPDLLRRGVRLFQPTYTASGLLAGSSTPDDDRGLLDLGRRFLESLAELSEIGSRPIVDLAHLNPRASGDVLAWFESDPERPRRLIPVYSHGAIRHPGFDRPRALTPDNLARLRALGGVVGLTPAFYDSAEGFRRGIESVMALPFLGREGHEGVCIGTDFLGVDANPPGLGTAPEVVAWAGSTFPPDVAAALVHENARRLIERAIESQGLPAVESPLPSRSSRRSDSSSPGRLSSRRRPSRGSSSSRSIWSAVPLLPPPAATRRSTMIRSPGRI